MSCPFHHAAAPKPKQEPKPEDETALAEIGEGEPIPQPPEKMFTGNLGEIDESFAIKSFWRLAGIYGPLF